MSTSSFDAHVLFLAVGAQANHREVYADLIAKIKEKAVLIQPLDSISTAIQQLERPFRVVFVNSQVLINPQNKDVWEAVLGYVRGGGIAICIGDFSEISTTVPQRKPVRKPFADARLLWKFDEKHRADVHLNREYLSLPPDVMETLPKSYNARSIFLRNVETKDVWYRPTEEDITPLEVVEAGHVNPFSFSVAMTKLGLGKLGYVGDCGGATPTSVLMAMAGLTE
ncbi:hypothetical protein N7454_007845 [Penicillium verhagenii]|nr:hypothetical protein N7454_007845 [Penicillium verhagenii]